MNNHQRQPQYLPAEFAKQALIMFVWPDESTDWQGEGLFNIQNTYLELIHKAALFLSPWVICRSTKIQSQIEQQLRKTRHPVYFSRCEYNDTWIRDYGPIVTKTTDTSIEYTHTVNRFVFNGWGNKYAHEADAQVCRNLWDQGAFHEHYLPLLRSNSAVLQHEAAVMQFKSHECILEGGSIDVNGQGTLITSESCLLNKNRGNRSKQHMETTLAELLGIEGFHWIAEGELLGDDTDAHIDTLVRFVNQDTLIVQSCDKPADPHFNSLSAMCEALASLRSPKNEPYRIVKLPLPEARYNTQGERLPATYANFTLVNNGILFPIYDCPEDEEAIKIMSAACPTHQIVPINANALIEGSGSIHCATMQLPY